jgi:hypothetical protein
MLCAKKAENCLRRDFETWWVASVGGDDPAGSTLSEVEGRPSMTVLVVLKYDVKPAGWTTSWPSLRAQPV